MAKDNYEDNYLPRFEDENRFLRVTLWEMNFASRNRSYLMGTFLEVT